MSYQERPVPLITIENGVFSVSKEAESILKDIKGPIGVTCVAGLYRTGKSYVLNRLLDRQSGFEIGPTVNAQTKGIYIWGKPIEVPLNSGETLRIILVDTEGIGSFDQEQTYDTKIFALAVLLSSYFIFNSFGVIDEGALDKLSLVSNLSKHIQIASSKLGDAASSGSDSKKGKSKPKEIEISPENSHLSTFFPSFMWLLRDFTLDLVDQDHRPITPKQYLEEALVQKPGLSERIKEKNLIRQAITDFFRDRDCFTVIRPVSDEKALRTVDQIPSDKLRPEFLKQVNDFKLKVLRSTKPKTLFGKTLSGEGLVVLCKNYVNAINNGAVPSIRNAWENLGLVENPKILKACVSVFVRTISQEIEKNGGFPIDDHALNTANDLALSLALREFDEKCIQNVDIDRFHEELKKEISEEKTKIESRNNEETGKACKKLLSELYDTLNAKMEKGVYEDLVVLMEDWSLLRRKYMDSPIVARSAKTRALAELAELEHLKMGNMIVRLGNIQKSKYDQKLEEMGKELKKNNEERERVVKEMRSEYDKVRNEKEVAVLERVKIGAERDKIETEKNSLQTQFATQTRIFEKENLALQAKISSLEGEKANLEQKLKSIFEEKVSTEAKARTIFEEKSLLEGRLALVSQEKVSLEGRVKDLKEEKSSLEGKIRTLIEEKTIAEKGLNTEIVDAKRKEEMLRNELRQKEEKYQDEISKKTREFNEKILFESSQKKGVEEMKDSLTRRYNSLQEELEVMKRRSQLLGQEKESLQKTLEDRARSFEDVVRIRESEISRLALEINRAKEALENESTVNRTLQARLDQTFEQLRLSQDEVKSLQKAISQKEAIHTNGTSSTTRTERKHKIVDDDETMENTTEEEEINDYQEVDTARKTKEGSSDKDKKSEKPTTSSTTIDYQKEAETMTIPQLKSLLTKWGVNLPATQGKKADYVELYKKHKPSHH